MYETQKWVNNGPKIILSINVVKSKVIPILSGWDKNGNRHTNVIKI